MKEIINFLSLPLAVRTVRKAIGEKIFGDAQEEYATRTYHALLEELVQG